MIRRWLAAGLAAGLASISICASAAVPAAGGVRIFEALERSPVSVIGRLSEPWKVDARTYTADLTVEESLGGGGHERGDSLVIAWEEQSPQRPVRFSGGDRILVSLEPLPGHSIWRQRFPDYAQRSKILAVAESGDAFLREPSLGAVGLLQHFLALPPDLRERNAGVGYLVKLAEGAQVPLARSSAERLAKVTHLDRQLDPTSAKRFVRALLRPDSDETLRALLLDLVGGRSLESLRSPLEALTGRDELAPATAFEALARLAGTLAEARVERLLAQDESPEHRAVGARYATGDAEARLPRLLRRDPDPRVRAAAVTRWVELRGVDGIDRALFGMADEDSSVRNAALLAIGGIGPEAVPALIDVLQNGQPEAARSAVAALQLAGGDDAYAAIAQAASSHPDAGVRTLARAALGRPIGHTD